MKKLIIAICVLTISLGACKKDEEKENAFSFNGQSYSTTHGYKLRQLYTDTSSVYIVFLAPETLLYNTNQGDFVGIGHYLTLMVYSKSPSDILPNLYSYNKTLVDASIKANIDTQNAIPGDEYFIGADGPGTADVLVNDGNFEITYSFLLENSISVDGYYKGTLEEIFLSE